MVEAPDFSECVRDNWRFDGDMTRTLADFTDKLRNWNKCVYGHINHRKRQLIHKLSNIQRVMDSTRYTFLAQQELEVWEKIDNNLHY